MSATQTASNTSSYTVADVHDVVRQLTTDLKMMANSSGTLSEQTAAEYGHDIEMLATEGYLTAVDVTLLNSLGGEVRAVRYDVDEDTGKITSSRPGGVLWPKTLGGSIRIVLSHTKALTDEAMAAMQKKLKRNWVDSSVDTSHANLKSSGSRDYASNGFGLHRKDWS
ncbi:hypothetical protein CN311_06210 [Mesorhizobium sanjuanii]|uniref:Bacterial HORMA domain-containing protein n=1 Tax=Mesorhizobium sanjuanii TaxID=2037900 RepID=A0A2A6FJ60_9HYPH|nr:MULTISPECIES: hypothetical protein [Mesorhizobium]PDQ22009.1 hypothetical protein CN311_06210 [Mesorhizobium sanjuanii]CCV11765.1 conserved hypothetical protein [Mesorhizobium sp. STM 4661]